MNKYEKLQKLKEELNQIAEKDEIVAKLKEYIDLVVYSHSNGVLHR